MPQEKVTIKWNGQTYSEDVLTWGAGEKGMEKELNVSFNIRSTRIALGSQIEITNATWTGDLGCPYDESGFYEVVGIDAPNSIITIRPL